MSVWSPVRRAASSRAGLSEEPISGRTVPILRGYNFGTNVGNNFREGGDWQYSRIENGIDIAGRVERTIGYLRTSYDLTDNVNAYIEGQYSDTSTTNIANPNRRLGNNMMLYR